jgi:hypothetical protein
VNPKSVTGDELYGYMTLAKDWKDGVLSIIMRGMAKNVPEKNFHDYQTYKVWLRQYLLCVDDEVDSSVVGRIRWRY